MKKQETVDDDNFIDVEGIRDSIFDSDSDSDLEEIASINLIFQIMRGTLTFKLQKIALRDSLLRLH